MCLWVLLVAGASLRTLAGGPSWDIRLSHDAASGVSVVAAVRSTGVGWVYGIRPGWRVLAVDGQDAAQLAEIEEAQAVVVQAPDGAVRTVVPDPVPVSVMLLLVAGSLLLAGLGAVVYRWTAERRLATAFLVFSVASATALASVPGSLMGSGVAAVAASVGALIASPGLAAVFLWFPRPLRWTRPAAFVLVVPTLVLVCANLLALLAENDVPRPLSEVLNSWLGLTLVGAAVLFAVRAIQPDSRQALAPVAVGVGVGVAPLALFNALPRVVGVPPALPIEVAAISIGVIPLTFAYAILRHRLFGLDALLRRVLLQVGSVSAMVGTFVVFWLVLRPLSLDLFATGVLAAAAVSALAPLLMRGVQRALDRLLYPWLHEVSGGRLTFATNTARETGLAATARLRQLVPVRWTICVAQDEAAPGEAPYWRMLAADGEGTPGLVGTHRGALTRLDALAPTATLVPIMRARAQIGALLVGPRLDGQPLSGLELESCELFAHLLAPQLEAALLRERAGDEAWFREGLSLFARELSAAGAVDDVLRLTARHSAHLLRAISTRGVVRDAQSDFALAEPLRYARASSSRAAAATPARKATDWERLAQAPVTRHASGRADDGDVRAPWLAFRLGEPGSIEAVVAVHRRPDDEAFSIREERRAGEVADHASGALRRAQVSTQAAEAEALRELNRLRTDFMNMVTHDLQNPLTVISGFADLLHHRAERLDPAAVVDMARAIKDAAQSGQRLVDDLLTDAKLEQGRLTLRREQVNAQQFLAALAQSFQQLPEGRRLRVEIVEPAYVHADPARLGQMVGNLIQNAFRYAPSGPIVLRLARSARDEVSIEVSDRGPGIQPEDQPRVWEKFFRAGNRHGSGGAGIGLSVVRTLAELHGGRVELESAPGQGSTFRILLSPFQAQLTAVSVA